IDLSARASPKPIPSVSAAARPASSHDMSRTHVHGDASAVSRRWVFIGVISIDTSSGRRRIDEPTALCKVFAYRSMHDLHRLDGNSATKFRRCDHVHRPSDSARHRRLAPLRTGNVRNRSDKEAIMRKLVRDAMTPNPRTIGGGASVLEAAQLMERADVG